MDHVLWNVSLNMNPLQLSNPRTAFESYTKPLMNKYIPDLKGMLIHVDYQTLALKTSPEFGNFCNVALNCIIRLHPIYPVARVRNWSILLRFNTIILLTIWFLFFSFSCIRYFRKVILCDKNMLYLLLISHLFKAIFLTLIVSDIIITLKAISIRRFTPMSSKVVNFYFC